MLDAVRATAGGMFRPIGAKAPPKKPELHEVFAAVDARMSKTGETGSATKGIRYHKRGYPVPCNRQAGWGCPVDFHGAEYCKRGGRTQELDHRQVAGVKVVPWVLASGWGGQEHPAFIEVPLGVIQMHWIPLKSH